MKRTNLSWLLSIVMFAAAALPLASCHKDDNPKESDNPEENPTEQIDNLVSYYDDLAYFQSVFVLSADRRSGQFPLSLNGRSSLRERHRTPLHRR